MRVTCKYRLHHVSINRNMRCIEMCFSVLCVVENALINRNMRCIEIWSAGEVRVLPLPINRNMRCIEMSSLALGVFLIPGLIET